MTPPIFVPNAEGSGTQFMAWRLYEADVQDLTNTSNGLSVTEITHEKKHEQHCRGETVRQQANGQPCSSLVGLTLLGGHDKRYDQAVETQHLGEYKDQDHPNEQARLLCCTTYAGVPDNPDCKSGRETGKADSQTSSEVHERAVHSQYRD